MLGHIHLFSSFINQSEPPDMCKNTKRHGSHMLIVTSIYYRISSLKMNHLTCVKTLKGMVHICLVTSIYYRVSSLKMNHLTSVKSLKDMVHICKVTSIYYRVSSLKMHHLTSVKHWKAWFTYTWSHPSIIEFRHSI
jgi:hypothetical protein